MQQSQTSANPWVRFDFKFSQFKRFQFLFWFPNFRLCQVCFRPPLHCSGRDSPPLLLRQLHPRLLRRQRSQWLEMARAQGPAARLQNEIFTKKLKRKDLKACTGLSEAKNELAWNTSKRTPELQKIKPGRSLKPSSNCKHASKPGSCESDSVTRHFDTSLLGMPLAEARLMLVSPNLPAAFSATYHMLRTQTAEKNKLRKGIGLVLAVAVNQSSFTSLSFSNGAL